MQKVEQVKGSWPEQDAQTKKWVLASLSVCEERKGVFCVKVRRGHQIDEEFLSGGEVDAYVAKLLPTDTTVLWSGYFRDCAANGCDPLAVLPRPEPRRETYMVELQMRESGIYLADDHCPTVVQHKLFCVQTPEGLMVGREWSARFAKGTDRLVFPVTVDVPPTSAECKVWYRNLFVERSYSTPIKRNYVHHLRNHRKTRPNSMAA